MILDFYNKLKIKFFDDPYGKSFMSKSGSAVRFFDISKNFKDIDLIDDNDIKKFLVKNKDVYFIPLELPNKEIFGFVLKSINSKKFYNIRLKEQYPQVFGLYDFYDFKFNKPVILLEGIKDCQFVKLFYPWTLAYLTSQPSKLLFEYLKNITSRLIFIPDNDKAGRDIKIYEKFKNYVKYYCTVSNKKNFKNFKDFGSYWDTGDKEFIANIEMILRRERLID